MSMKDCINSKTQMTCTMQQCRNCNRKYIWNDNQPAHLKPYCGKDCYATFALTAHRNIEPPMRENYWQRRYEERRELAYKSLDEKFAMNASNRTTENSYAASIDSDDDSP